MNRLIKKINKAICLIAVGACVMAGSRYTINANAASEEYQPFTVDDTTVTVKVKSGSSIEKEVNAAINYVKELNAQTKKTYTVKIPKGTYKLSASIHVYNDLVLDARGSVIKSVQAQGNMLFMGDKELNLDKNLRSKYGKDSDNVTIKGGKWVGNTSNQSSLMILAHAKDITFDGVTFYGGGGKHQLEVTAIDGFTVKNCQFKNSKSKLGAKREALQLDIPVGEETFKNIIQDGTPMRNVLITGCTFENVQRGIGTHSMLLGQSHENIKITNNVFNKVTGECIIALNYYNCEISGNKMIKCGAGIVCQAFKKTVNTVYTTVFDGKKAFKGKFRYDLKTKIYDNEIEVINKGDADAPLAIKVAGYNLKQEATNGGGDKKTVKANNYYIKNVRVENNKIKTCGQGIILQDAWSCKLLNNKITGTNMKSEKDAIFLEEACKNITINGNIIKNAGRIGISVKDKSTLKEVIGNTIENSAVSGIVLLESSCKGAMTKNKITKAKEYGILLVKGSSVKKLTKNTIKQAKMKAIAIYN